MIKKEKKLNLDENKRHLSEKENTKKYLTSPNSTKGTAVKNSL